MKKSILIALAILLIFPGSTVAFDDLKEDHTYREAIHFVRDKNIVKGYNDGSFKPNRKINRAELLKIVIGSRYAEGQINSALNEYRSRDYWYVDMKDVDIDAWYGPHVRIAVRDGVIQGYEDGSFRPAQNVNFVEALKIALEAYDIPYDRNSDPWYKGLVDKGAELNLNPHDITAFNQTISRAQMAEIMTRVIKYSEGTLNNYLWGVVDEPQTYEEIRQGNSNVAKFKKRKELIRTIQYTDAPEVDFASGEFPDWASELDLYIPEGFDVDPQSIDSKIDEYGYGRFQIVLTSTDSEAIDAVDKLAEKYSLSRNTEVEEASELREGVHFQVYGDASAPYKKDSDLSVYLSARDSDDRQLSFIILSVADLGYRPETRGQAIEDMSHAETDNMIEAFDFPDWVLDLGFVEPANMERGTFHPNDPSLESAEESYELVEYNWQGDAGEATDHALKLADIFGAERSILLEERIKNLSSEFTLENYEIMAYGDLEGGFGKNGNYGIALVAEESDDHSLLAVSIHDVEGRNKSLGLTFSPPSDSEPIRVIGRNTLLPTWALNVGLEDPEGMNLIAEGYNESSKDGELGYELFEATFQGEPGTAQSYATQFATFFGIERNVEIEEFSREFVGSFTGINSEDFDYFNFSNPNLTVGPNLSYELSLEAVEEDEVSTLILRIYNLRQSSERNDSAFDPPQYYSSDVVRASDLSTIAQAIEIYKSDHGNYPGEIAMPVCLDGSSEISGLLNEYFKDGHVIVPYVEVSEHMVQLSDKVCQDGYLYIKLADGFALLSQVQTYRFGTYDSSLSFEPTHSSTMNDLTSALERPSEEEASRDHLLFIHTSDL